MLETYKFVVDRQLISTRILDLTNAPLKSRAIKKIIKGWIFSMCEAVDDDSIERFADNIENIGLETIEATSTGKYYETITTVMRGTKNIVVKNYKRTCTLKRIYPSE